MDVTVYNPIEPAPHQACGYENHSNKCQHEPERFRHC